MMEGILTPHVALLISFHVYIKSRRGSRYGELGGQGFKGAAN